jgi:hypothetical protein
VPDDGVLPGRRERRTIRQELAGRGYELTEVRILDLLILSVQAAA